MPERERELENRSRVSFFDRERVDSFCEKGIIGCIIAILIYGPLTLGSARNSEFAGITLLLAAATFLWVVRLWVRDQYRVLWAPICWTVVAFTGYAIYRWQSADVEYLARHEVLRVVAYGILFFLVLDNCNRQETFQWLVLAMIIVGGVISAYGAYQYLTGLEKVWHLPKEINYKGRATGTYYSPNHFAGYLEMVVPLALALVFNGRIKHLSKILIGYAAILMLAGLGFSISRGAWFASGFSLLVFFFLLVRNRDHRIPALVCLVVLIGAASYASIRSFKALSRIQQLSLPQARFDYWKPAIQMWKTSPWTGVGPNHYDWRFREYRYWQVQGRPVYTHNEYLNILADYGIIGAGLVLAAFSLAGWGVVRTWKFVRRQNEISTRPSNRSALVLGATIGLVAMLAHAAVDFNMHIPANAIAAIVLLAILTGHIRYGTERFWVNPRVPGRFLATVILLAGGIWVGWQGVRFGIEDRLLQKAKRLVIESPERLDLLKQAYTLEPNNFATVRDIGDLIRRQGWQGNEGYQELLQTAISWFDRATALNRYDPYSLAYKGMCLHWLNQPEQAGDAFDRALKLDPQGSYIMALYGWHLIQIGKLKEAHEILRLADIYLVNKHEMAQAYLKIVERRLAEEAQTR